ncbi:MAG: dipeptide epimerase [candidate division KSB1 bacterium]|nr:dipeptide epimerase [candidate division KSB1 bacterium]MDZ7365524.1 dipeptide epimerase [candidate division KSB1 bacterium]MDZ7403627.1 dipeptide epimerase [candidate division KSB1 bacterium]
MILSSRIIRLHLKHTWTISRASVDYHDNIFVYLEHDGVTGVGEASFSKRYGESLESLQEFIESAKPIVAKADPRHFVETGEVIQNLGNGQNAAKAALDMALMDWVGKKYGVPLFRLWGLNPARTPISSFTIGIDTPEMMQRKIREAEAFPILKIKLGTQHDADIMRAVREVTDKPLRVDANEGWKSKEEALEKICWLSQFNIEFVEQPLPASRLNEVRWLRQQLQQRGVAMPLFADEDSKKLHDLPALAGVYDGINIKLMKAGGVQEAWRMIHLARSLGLKIMLGCMIESSVGITAAAHLAPLADHADLDGHLLISNDPFIGAPIQNGRIVLPEAPGLGVIYKT